MFCQLVIPAKCRNSMNKFTTKAENRDTGRKICTFKKIRRNLYMKATGIVRRIDDLGRIVIPKEIRRTMRIREGDPLEIYTSPEGEVIFKKYSPVGEISATASQYADVLSKVGGCPAVICDRDHVIAVSGMSKKEVIERRVSGSLEDLIESRKSYVCKNKDDRRLNPIEGIDRYAIACSPILAQGDVNGAVIMLANDGNDVATGEQSALVQAAAMYFGKQMEE